MSGKKVKGTTKICRDTQKLCYDRELEECLRKQLKDCRDIICEEVQEKCRNTEMNIATKL